ncbi:MAG: hypothetical protein KAH24_10545 [Holophagae bacterium]|nr:hypothetical protein [Holophagae bacterium]
MKRIAALLTMIFIGMGSVALPLQAQKIDLVKLKKEEAERRKKLAQKKKIKGQLVRVDDTNLKKIAAKSRPLGYVKTGSDTAKKNSGEPIPAQPLIVGSETGGEPEIGGDDGKHNAEYWQQLKRGLEEGIVDLEKRLRTDQLRLNQLHFEYLNQDLPLKKQQIKEELDKLRLKHESDKERLKTLNRELEQLHERARRAGVPPGWLR